jgi:hypothetical protein
VDSHGKALLLAINIESEVGGRSRRHPYVLPPGQGKVIQPAVRKDRPINVLRPQNRSNIASAKILAHEYGGLIVCVDRTSYTVQQNADEAPLLGRKRQSKAFWTV